MRSIGFLGAKTKDPNSSKAFASCEPTISAPHKQYSQLVAQHRPHNTEDRSGGLSIGFRTRFQMKRIFFAAFLGNFFASEHAWLVSSEGRSTSSRAGRASSNGFAWCCRPCGGGCQIFARFSWHHRGQQCSASSFGRHVHPKSLKTVKRTTRRKRT